MEGRLRLISEHKRTQPKMTHVSLEPYTRMWFYLFQKERILLRVILRKHIIRIQHIGSTSIPGMIAKPIIDILVAVPNYEEASDYIHRIKSIGYEYQGENSTLRQYYFIKRRPNGYQLYFVERDSKTWNERIAFRNLLLNNPTIPADYSEYKQQLAIQFSVDLDAYQMEKGEYIRKVLDTALDP